MKQEDPYGRGSLHVLPQKSKNKPCSSAHTNEVCLEEKQIDTRDSQKLEHLFSGLEQMGELLVTTRNHFSILGQRQCYQKHYTETLLQAPPTSLLYQETINGSNESIYRFKFKNHTNFLFHKVCLTRNSDIRHCHKMVSSLALANTCLDEANRTGNTYKESHSQDFSNHHILTEPVSKQDLFHILNHLKNNSAECEVTVCSNGLHQKAKVYAKHIDQRNSRITLCGKKSNCHISLSESYFIHWKILPDGDSIDWVIRMQNNRGDYCDISSQVALPHGIGRVIGLN